jgi:pyruvate/2-oxoglutarate dehydrogenase complex dihydrolipoamide acyltransferase (E2) component
MATEVLLPKLGFQMNEGTLAEWLVHDGAEIKEGEPLYTLESEKSTQEIDAPASGKLKILKNVGDICPVGTVLAMIE